MNDILLSGSSYNSYNSHDGIAQALGIDSMDDFYRSRYYYTPFDDDDTNTDEETETDEIDINRNQNKNELAKALGISSMDDFWKAAYIPKTKTLTTRHHGFPNLKYLYLGDRFGSLILRYFCHKAKVWDELHGLFIYFAGL